MWNMRAFKKAHTFAVAGDPVLDSLAFSPDGRLLLAAANDGLLRLFNTTAKSEVAPPNGLISRCCLCPKTCASVAVMMMWLVLAGSRLLMRTACVCAHVMS